MYSNNKIKAKLLYKKKKYLFDSLKIIGVTGTNGKSSVTTLLYKYLRFIGEKATLIGTNGIYINDKYYESKNTTPGVEIIYDVLEKSYIENIKYVIMEVSSHAIKQFRVYKIPFYVKAITNISIDHLDFHKTFDSYRKCKLSFLNKSKILINNDINLIKKIKYNIFKKVYTYGKIKSDFTMNNINLSIKGLSFNLEHCGKIYNISSNLLGEFNCYNVLTFISILFLLNKFNYNKINSFLNSNIYIEGRMELFKFNNKLIVIDYAHTPDGMEKVLSFFRQINIGKIITLFGCGGNRDKSKRKLMGNIASKYSDLLFLTSDNPRNEQPINIIYDILNGVNQKYIINLDRKEAIKLAISLLDEYDCLLILGRGCERNHIIKNNIIKFSDIDYVKELINE